MSEIPEWMRREVYDLAGGRCECILSGCDHPIDLVGSGYVESLLGRSRCTRTFQYQRTSTVSLSLFAAALLTPQWHCDHKIRQSDGGPTAVANLQALCVPCHEEKTRRENS